MLSSYKINQMIENKKKFDFNQKRNSKNRNFSKLFTRSFEKKDNDF